MSIAKAIQDEKYFLAAINILKSTEEKWCDWSSDTDGLLLGSSDSYAGGWHKNLIYGDFYFVEAILKLKQNNFLIW